MDHTSDERLAHEFLPLRLSEEYENQTTDYAVDQARPRYKSHRALNGFLLLSLALNIILAVCLSSRELRLCKGRPTVTKYGIYGTNTLSLVSFY